MININENIIRAVLNSNRFFRQSYSRSGNTDRPKSNYVIDIDCTSGTLSETHELFYPYIGEANQRTSLQVNPEHTTLVNYATSYDLLSLVGRWIETDEPRAVCMGLPEYHTTEGGYLRTSEWGPSNISTNMKYFPWTNASKREVTISDDVGFVKESMATTCSYVVGGVMVLVGARTEWEITTAIIQYVNNATALMELKGLSLTRPTYAPIATLHIGDDMPSGSDGDEEVIKNLVDCSNGGSLPEDYFVIPLDILEVLSTSIQHDWMFHEGGRNEWDVSPLDKSTVSSIIWYFREWVKCSDTVTYTNSYSCDIMSGFRTRATAMRLYNPKMSFASIGEKVGVAGGTARSYFLKYKAVVDTTHVITSDDLTRSLTDVITTLTDSNMAVLDNLSDQYGASGERSDDTLPMPVYA